MQKELPTFRSANRADSATVQAMVFEILREYQLPSDPDGTDADLADLEHFYRHGWFAVLEWEGQIVGSVGLLPEKRGGEDVLELRKMYLRSTYRGRGWGRLMLERALQEARVLAARKITLGTATVLVEAVALYEQFGFRRTDYTHAAARCDQSWELDLAEATP
ncbi:MAG: GNAT family N-acetyltransferase [Verrucomicrobiota bacterium]|jgi:putative acetyltransferase|nr:GNAT family N-acetyltransferase [Verrucomicrobiota bacterium]